MIIITIIIVIIIIIAIIIIIISSSILYNYYDMDNSSLSLLNIISCTIAIGPKGGRTLLMSPPCLGSQGCHLIPSFCLLSVILPSPVAPFVFS